LTELTNQICTSYIQIRKLSMAGLWYYC